MESTTHDFCEKRRLKRFRWGALCGFVVGVLAVLLVGSLTGNSYYVRRVHLRDRLQDCRASLIAQTVRAKGLKKCEAHVLRLQEECK